MILKQAQIENYKIVEDSTPFAIDQVTCLVGKNESGKSAILEALYKIKPVEPECLNFTDLDYPRRRISVVEETGELKKENVLTTEWELEATDIEAVVGGVGFNPFLSNQLTLKKGYSNTLVWEHSLDCSMAVKRHIDSSNMNEREKEDIQGISTITNLIKHMKDVSVPSESQTQLLQELNRIYPSGSLKALVDNLLQKRLPTFVYFTEYFRMPGKVSLPEVTRLKASNTLTPEDKVFLAFLELANATIEEFEGVATTEKLFMKLEAVSNRISGEIFEYWTQNQHLDVEFRYDQARPQDPAPYNNGYVFNTRIKNNRHKASVGFDQRSTGFIWFFSFLVWFSQVKKNYGDNLVILLDEPGLALHAKAQADLLRYIEEKLRPHHQVIYTTHSPFMIDAESLLAVRTVEDRTAKDSRGRDVIEGTKVGSEILSTDADTLLPLQGALGYDITQTLFVGAHTLLVEGPSDILYLKVMSSALHKCGRKGLNAKWTLAPAGGLDKVYSFVTLFSGRRLHTAVIADIQHGDKAKLQKLRDHAVLKAGHVLTLDIYTQQAEADIEDLIGREGYFDIVRKTYGLKVAELPARKETSAPIRCVKEMEDRFRLLPSQPDFDHYSPAQYFAEHISEFYGKLTGWDEALNRFETLFNDVNSLLGD